MATIIHWVAKKGNVNRVRNLLNQGTNVNTRNQWDSTPLHWSAAYGHLDTVRFLLSRGANVNARNQEGITPLHSAAAQGHVRIVEELIRHGAHVNARDTWGRTPLHMAVIHEHPQSIRVLVKAGAKLSYRNMNGRTPLNKVELWGILGTKKSRAALGARSVQKWKNFTQKRIHARNTAMRQTLSRIPIREGNVMRQGLPTNIINRISRNIRRKNSSS
jgi:ankyrin repeat protein